MPWYRRALMAVLPLAVTTMAAGQTVLTAPPRPARTFRPPVSTSDIGRRLRPVDTLRVARPAFAVTRVTAPFRIGRPHLSLADQAPVLARNAPLPAPPLISKAGAPAVVPAPATAASVPVTTTRAAPPPSDATPRPVAAASAPAVAASRPPAAAPRTSAAAAGSVAVAPGPSVARPKPSAAPPAPATPAAEATATTTTSGVPDRLPSAAGWARVSYLSGGTIYLDAGTKAGLRTATHLDVMRGTAFVAELVVDYVSSSRASCSVVRSAASVAVGDSAHFTPARGTVTADESGAVVTATSTRSARSARRPLRGRLGIRYLTIDPGLGPEARISQPAFDVRLDGQQLGGAPIGVTVDMRAYRERRSSRDSSGARRYSPADVTRIYQTSLSWTAPGTPARVTVGRQFSSALSTIGLFDGLAIDMDGNRLSYGGVAGSQPEPVRFGLSGQIREYGLWLQLHNARGSAPVWNTTLGALGSYNKGAIDREFVYLQSMLASPRWSFYATQEVDVNRGWKADAEQQTATPTSTFLMGRVALNDVLSLNAGYDNRRSVRLYRDFVNAETEFDDSFRKGAWGGAAVSVAGRFRASVDARTSGGGSGGTTSSWTEMGGVYRLTPLQVGAHVRSTQYSGTASQGQLTAASLEMTPFGALHVEATGGLREDRNAFAGDAPQRVTWQEATMDLGIGRSLYLMFSFYDERGVGTRSRQMYTALSYRF